MANKKISDLTAQTGANTADGDLFHTVDISETLDVNKNKSITKVELLNTLLPAGATYVPVFQGFGTMISTQYSYSLFNNTMMIWGEHTNGAVTPNALQIGLPIGYKVATGMVNTTFIGMFQRNALTTARYAVIATGGDIFLNITRLDTGTGAYVPMLGNAGMGSNEKQSFFATIHIEAV